jgi:hypothetical protein
MTVRHLRNRRRATFIPAPHSLISRPTKAGGREATNAKPNEEVELRTGSLPGILTGTLTGTAGIIREYRPETGPRSERPREDGAEIGYGLALVTTDWQATSPAALLTRYAWRWSIAVTFAEARELLGVGQARNRTENAVRGTVPFGPYAYSINVLWYTLNGHHPADAADRHEAAPWRTTKTEPALSDMLAKLRRGIIAARLLPTHPAQPTDAEIRAVRQAWASASHDLAA